MLVHVRRLPLAATTAAAYDRFQQLAADTANVASREVSPTYQSILTYEAKLKVEKTTRLALEGRLTTCGPYQPYCSIWARGGMQPGQGYDNSAEFSRTHRLETSKPQTTNHKIPRAHHNVSFVAGGQKTVWRPQVASKWSITCSVTLDM